MLIRSLASLLLAASSVQAVKDAFPFVLLSTEAIPSSTLQSSQISTADRIENGLKSALGAFDPTTQYVFIEQGGVRASDLRDGSAMPKMRRRMGDEVYKSMVQVPDVVGVVDLNNVMDGEIGQAATVLKFPTIRKDESEDGRRQILGETDAAIDARLSTLLSNHTSHVIVYLSVPVTHETGDEVAQDQDYKMDEPPFHENMHTDLKRDLEHGLRRRQESGNDDFQNGLPLFEKYQFLTPGIFMGLSVSLVLFGILYVGISAIAGLEVSYMAFSKEMGPQGQQAKKQQ